MANRSNPDQGPSAQPAPSRTPRTPGTHAGINLPMPIWDLPTRLFHWLLVVLIVVSYVSVEVFSNMRVHMLSGQTILALLLFRIVWGFVGSDTARFMWFLKSPLAAVRHLLHFTRRAPDTVVGHNEAGGWMVVCLLALLLAQTLFGLFANNEDSFVEGPLSRLVGSEWGAWALHQHYLVEKLIKLAVLLHILAIIGYAVVKRHNLVRPMLTGKKRLPAATPAPRMAGTALALAILALSASLVWFAVNKL